MNKQRARAEIFWVWCIHTGVLPCAVGHFIRRKPNLWICVSPERISEGCQRAHPLGRRRDLEEERWWHVRSPGPAKTQLGQVAQRFSRRPELPFTTQGISGLCLHVGYHVFSSFKAEGKLLVQQDVRGAEQSPSIFQARGRCLSRSPPWLETNDHSMAGAGGPGCRTDPA